MSVQKPDMPYFEFVGPKWGGLVDQFQTIGAKWHFPISEKMFGQAYQLYHGDSIDDVKRKLAQFAGKWYRRMVSPAHHAWIAIFRLKGEIHKLESQMKWLYFQLPSGRLNLIQKIGYLLLLGEIYRTPPPYESPYDWKRINALH